jgi:starch phosphorylase
MESMATVGLPAIGYGIRYDYGLFRQSIADGWQKEAPDNWLVRGNPWEIERPEIVYPVQFGGSVERCETADGQVRHVWRQGESVHAAAFDTLVPGWGGERVNTLRLWAARAVEPLELDRSIPEITSGRRRTRLGPRQFRASSTPAMPRLQDRSCA